MTVVQKNLIRIIEEKELKKKGVARRAGMTQQGLCDVIAGRKLIRAEMVPQLALALGVDVTELFRDDGNEKGA